MYFNHWGVSLQGHELVFVGGDRNWLDFNGLAGVG
jgi:hypothetical protein